MLRQTPIFIVTSTRPRVGKTLIARAFIEFFCAQSRPVAAFDVNPDEFALMGHLPAFTAAASIRDTRGEMALFDQLVIPDAVPKIVDLGHEAFNRFFTVLQQINFSAEARRRAITPMVLFVADADERARQGYAMLRHRLPDLALVPVLNEAMPHAVGYRADFPPTPRGGDPVIFPELSAILRSVINRPGFSFRGYASRTTDTTSELYTWLRRVSFIFRDLEIRLLLGALKPRLRQSA